MDRLLGMEQLHCGLDLAKSVARRPHSLSYPPHTFPVILQMRVWALYNCNKALLYIMVPAFISEVIAKSVILALSNVVVAGERVLSLCSS